MLLEQEILEQEREEAVQKVQKSLSDLNENLAALTKLKVAYWLYDAADRQVMLPPKKIRAYTTTTKYYGQGNQ